MLKCINIFFRVATQLLILLGLVICVAYSHEHSQLYYHKVQKVDITKICIALLVFVLMAKTLVNQEIWSRKGQGNVEC